MAFQTSGFAFQGAGQFAFQTIDAVIAGGPPDGAPGGKRRRLLFRGKFYDSERDKYRLAMDMQNFFEAEQAEKIEPEQPAKTKTRRKAKTLKQAAEVIAEINDAFAVIAAQQVAQDDYLATVRAIIDLMDEEELFLMMAV